MPEAICWANRSKAEAICPSGYSSALQGWWKEDDMTKGDMTEG